MIVDSSVVVAIVGREPGFEELLTTLERAGELAISAPTLVECGIVLEARFGVDARGTLERFLRDLDVEVLAFDEEHWREALDAYRRFGRGRHPAGLNFGDCLSYAAATVADRPLLFTGRDFERTGVRRG